MLPGLGGFVCNSRSAWYDESKCQIVPPSRDVHFNPRLTSNDGVVANELMLRHGLSYAQAQQVVNALILAIQQDLKGGNTVELPGLGRLYFETDGQLRFMADVEFERMMQSFGHASIPLVAKKRSQNEEVKLEPLEAAQGTSTSESQEEELRGKVIPLRIKVGRAAAAVAIPLTLAGAYFLADPQGHETLFGSNPFWHAQPKQASYAPAVHNPIVEEYAKRVNEPLPVETTSEVSTDVVENVPNNEPKDDAVKDDKKVLPTESSAIRFLIIGGAFSVEANANKLASSLEEEGFQTSTHVQSHNGLIAVSLGGYATEEEARKALASVRSRGQEKAWLKRL